MRLDRIVAATLGALIAIPWVPAHAVAGRLDPAFSGDGWTRKAFVPGQESHLAGVIRGPKGTIVGAGRVGTGAGTDMAVMRLRTGGGADTSFGGGDGVTTLDFNGDEDTVGGVARDGHGRIVVAGDAVDAGAPEFALARVRRGGAPDPSFSDDGEQTTALLGLGSSALDVAVDGNDRVIAVGYTQSEPSGYQAAIVRYREDGTLDPNFSSDGVVFPDVTGTSDLAWAVDVDGKNRVVVAGAYTTPGDVERWFVLRLRPGGALDTTFAGDGIREFGRWPGAGSTDDGRAYAVAVADSGRLLMGGYQEVGGSARIAVARMAGDGTFDKTFSGDGRAAFLADGHQAEVDEVLADGKGRIVFAGYTYGAVNLVVGRLTASGARDSSLGGDGVAVPNLTGANYGNAAFLDAKGRLVVGGSSYATDVRALVARFLMA
jgi:uncharacterized delta-60 repeat protein